MTTISSNLYQSVLEKYKGNFSTQIPFISTNKIQPFESTNKKSIKLIEAENEAFENSKENIEASINKLNKVQTNINQMDDSLTSFNKMKDSLVSLNIKSKLEHYQSFEKTKVKKQETPTEVNPLANKSEEIKTENKTKKIKENSEISAKNNKDINVANTDDKKINFEIKEKSDIKFKPTNNLKEENNNFAKISTSNIEVYDYKVIQAKDSYEKTMDSIYTLQEDNQIDLLNINNNELSQFNLFL